MAQCVWPRTDVAHFEENSSKIQITNKSQLVYAMSIYTSIRMCMLDVCAHALAGCDKADTLDAIGGLHPLLQFLKACPMIT